jgi:hypothetical protein
MKRVSGASLLPNHSMIESRQRKTLTGPWSVDCQCKLALKTWSSPEFGTWCCPRKIWKLTHVGGQSQHGNNTGTIRWIWCRICAGDAPSVQHLQLESFSIADAEKIQDFAMININWSDSLTFQATHHKPAQPAISGHRAGRVGNSVKNFDWIRDSPKISEDLTKTEWLNFEWILEFLTELNNSYLVNQSWWRHFQILNWKKVKKMHFYTRKDIFSRSFWLTE